MIQEIVNFMNELREDSFDEGHCLRDEGLIVHLDLDSEYHPIPKSYSSIVYRKKEPEKDIEFLINNRIRKKEYYSECIGASKYLDQGAGGKKIHSSVPYAIWFKIENIEAVKERFVVFFNAAIILVNHEPIEVERIKLIKMFCEDSLLDQIKSDSNFNSLRNTDYIKVFFNFPISEYKTSYEFYISSNVFNQADRTKEFGQQIFLSGAPVKKRFIVPNTTSFKTNLKVSKLTAIQVEKFRRLLTSKPNKKLPNPLPIFIDKAELNNEFIRIFNRDLKLKYRDIIRQLYQIHGDDISNYYLINWANRNGIVINDVDYVSTFQFMLNNCTIKNCIGIKDKEGQFLKDELIENVFHFENRIVQLIFNKQLVSFKDDIAILKYFDELKYDSKYNTLINYQNTLKFRSSFYDYIYKSKQDAISGSAFYTLLLSTIIDDIKHDEYKDNRHTKEYSVKEKLNVLFSLNKMFDKQNNNFGGLDMSSKIPEYQENMRKLLSDNDYHIQTDQDFAFAAGQLIYYILTKNQGSNKTHALLEPYISKNEPELFKLMVTRGIEQYKHALEFGSRRFEKLAGEILAYNCGTKIKDLLPILFAGYFSQAMIFEKINNQS